MRKVITACVVFFVQAYLFGSTAQAAKPLHIVLTPEQVSRLHLNDYAKKMKNKASANRVIRWTKPVVVSALYLANSAVAAYGVINYLPAQVEKYRRKQEEKKVEKVGEKARGLFKIIREVPVLGALVPRHLPEMMVDQASKKYLDYTAPKMRDLSTVAIETGLHKKVFNLFSQKKTFIGDNGKESTPYDRAKQRAAEAVDRAPSLIAFNANPHVQELGFSLVAANSAMIAAGVGAFHLFVTQPLDKYVVTPLFKRGIHRLYHTPVPQKQLNRTAKTIQASVDAACKSQGSLKALPINNQWVNAVRTAQLDFNNGVYHEGRLLQPEDLSSLLSDDETDTAGLFYVLNDFECETPKGFFGRPSVSINEFVQSQETLPNPELSPESTVLSLTL